MLDWLWRNLIYVISQTGWSIFFSMISEIDSIQAKCCAKMTFENEMQEIVFVGIHNRWLIELPFRVKEYNAHLPFASDERICMDRIIHLQM